MSATKENSLVATIEEALEFEISINDKFAGLPHEQWHLMLNAEQTIEILRKEVLRLTKLLGEVINK